METRGSATRSAGILTAAAVAVAAAVLLVLLFAHAAIVRAEAASLNLAVTVCRSTADMYLLDGEMDALSERLETEGYAPQLQPDGVRFSAAQDGVSLEIELHTAEVGAALETVSVTASDGETVVYTLETKRCKGVERE